MPSTTPRFSPAQLGQLATGKPSTATAYTLTLTKGVERYIILYTDATRADALRMLGRWASDPGYSFDWYDAAVLSKRIRKLASK